MSVFLSDHSLFARRSFAPDGPSIYLLLAVLRDLGGSSATARKRQREAVLKIAAWSVRGPVHAQTGGGEAERTYITAAVDIRGGRLKTVAQLKQRFLDRGMLIVDDELRSPSSVLAATAPGSDDTPQRRRQWQLRPEHRRVLVSANRR
jgi:hypothetical protein